MKEVFPFYRCPTCHGPLSRLRGQLSDWFCRACRTAVVILNDQECRYLPCGDHGGVSRCAIEQLSPGARNEFPGA